MYTVVKRDGQEVDFNISKITSAITKAFEGIGKNYHPEVVNLLALNVTSDFSNKIINGKVAVEDIQDSVENVLIKAGYNDVENGMIPYTGYEKARLQQMVEDICYNNAKNYFNF